MKSRNPWHPKAALAADLDFPWRLFFAITAAVVAGHCLFGELHHLAEQHLPGWVRPLLAVVATLYAALVLYAQRLKFHLSRSSLLALVFAGLGLFVLGLDVHHVLKELAGSFAVVLAGAGVLAFALTLAHQWRHDLEGGRSLERIPATDYITKTGPIRALILTVSKPVARPGDNLEIVTMAGKTLARFLAEGKDPVELNGPDLPADIAKLSAIRPNWQQLLRALLPHHANLKTVILYGSADSRLEECRQFLRLYLAENITLETRRPVELEDFDAVHSFLKSEVQSLLRSGYSPQQVAVDITGGQKIPSVAGAVLTLNRDVVCQYVQSAGSAAERSTGLAAQIYDLRWDKALELPA